MRTQEEEKFADYFEKWVCRLEEYSHQLHSASREASITEQELLALVSKLTAHHKEYYTAKWAAAAAGGGGDVFAFFSPPWSTPLENAYSWLTGWKPSAVFRVLEALRARGAAVAEDQAKRIEQLRGRIRLEEERVEREMERQQVGVADRRMVDLARLEGRRGDAAAAAAAAAGTQLDGLADAAVKGLASGLERIMKAADCVRLKTLKVLLDELSPSQCVEFLAAMSTLQVQLRRWGKKRQSQAEHKSSQAC